MSDKIQNFIERHGLYEHAVEPPDKRNRTRANGEGSIRKRPDGTYEARVTLGFDEKTGKQIRKSFYGKTRAEAKEKMDTAIHALRTGSGMTQSKDITAAEWFDYWLVTYKKDLALNTIRNYSGIVTKYLLPRIGKTKLSKLNTPILQTILNGIPTERSTRMVEMTASVLRDSLGTAFKLGYLVYNPALNLILPKKKTQHKGRALTLAQEERFVQALADCPLRPLLLTYLYTGLRRGEALALTWADVDFTARTITVNGNASENRNANSKQAEYGVHSTKTESSRRIVPMSEKCCAVLHPLQGDADAFVFPSPEGGLMDINAAGRAFKEIMQSLGMDEFSLHSLRHTFATRCLERGVSPKVVQAWLGHASSDTTMDIYAHVNAESILAEIDKLN